MLTSRVLVVLAALGTVLGGGVAWAAWTASGTGSAGAQAVVPVTLTVTGGTPTATLYPLPGVGSYPVVTPAVGTVWFSTTNPNPYPVAFTQATFGAVTVTPAAGRTCASANVTVPVATRALSLTVAPGQTVTGVAVPSVLSMLTTAPDGCQGASVTVAVTLTGTSA